MVEAHADLITLHLGLADVHRRREQTRTGRRRHVDDHVVGHLAEPVEGNFELLSEEAQIDARVEDFHLLPRQIGIAVDKFVTRVVDDGLIAVERDIVVAQHTVRRADLEVVDKSGALHPRLAVDVPADSHRGEVAPLVPVAEERRSVAADADLGQILVLIAVIGLSEER